VSTRPADRTEIACAACGARHRGAWCPECGEPRIDGERLTLGRLVREAAEGLTDLDGRLWRSLIGLVRRPGALTAAWADGPRTRYLPALSIFLVLSVVVFLAAPHIGVFAFDLDNYLTVGLGTDTHRTAATSRFEASGLVEAAWTRRFNTTLGEFKRVFLVALMPMLALPVALLDTARRRPFAVHVVFAVHASAFMLLWLVVVAGVGRGVLFGLGWLSPGAASAVVGVALVVPIAAWLARAFGRVYGVGPFAAVRNAAALLAGATLLLVVYREVLFWVTLAVV